MMQFCPHCGRPLHIKVVITYKLYSEIKITCDDCEHALFNTSVESIELEQDMNELRKELD